MGSSFYVNGKKTTYTKVVIKEKERERDHQILENF